MQNVHFEAWEVKDKKTGNFSVEFTIDGGDGSSVVFTLPIEDASFFASIINRECNLARAKLLRRAKGSHSDPSDFNEWMD
jgi:hypothetical protein